MRPQILDVLGLLDAITWQAEEYKKRTSLKIDVHCNVDQMNIDRDRSTTVFRIFQETMTNVLRHSRAGDVQIRLLQEPDRLVLEVKDNGIGLSRAAARKVFNRFYQVDQTSTRSGRGCGLGLSIVKYIVAAHGGTVSVESEPNSGSVFKVTLPAAPQSELIPAGGR